MIYVIRWEINGGENWKDYRGGNIRDNNTYLTDKLDTNGPKKAKRFDSVSEAIEFGKEWMKKHTSKNVNPTEYTEGKNTILDYGKDEFDFGVQRLVIRVYRPRS